MPLPFVSGQSTAKALDFVSSVNEFVAVAAGKTHTVCLKKDGSVFSWGYGGSGQLGFTKSEIAKMDLTNAKIVHPI